MRWLWMVMLTLTCSLSACQSGSSAAVKGNAHHPGAGDVMAFWPSTPGLRMRFSGTRTRDRESVGTMEMVVVNGSMDSIHKVPVLQMQVSISSESTDGREDAGDLIAYQYIDSRQTYTHAYQQPGGKADVVKQRYYDLKAPLVVGQSWEFVARQSVQDSSLSELEIAYHSSVEETGLAMTVMDKAVEQCLRVREIGQTLTEPDVTCQDGEERRATIYTVRDRWWCPGLGAVREVTRETALTIGSPGSVCREYGTVYELVEVVEGGKANAAL